MNAILNIPAPIHSRALLVSLSVSTWSARKYDRRVTAQVNDEYAASADAGRYNKMLLPGDAVPYRTLIKAANAARTDHYRNTLAWSDEGWRLLPTANYTEYTDRMRAHAATFDAALAEFVDAYPRMREAARGLLNGMYRETDYPRIYDIRGKFRMSTEFTPLPTSGDIRLDLPASEIAAIAERVTGRVEAAAADAIEDAWARLGDVVGKLSDRLSDSDAIFRNSLIDNVRDMVDVLARLNFSDDPALEAMRQRVDTELTVYDAQELRDDDSARAATAAKAREIMAAMDGLYGVAS